jgi:MoxR-like ATPase
MFDLSSPWSREARNEARSLVRSQPGWAAWTARHPEVNTSAPSKDEIIQAAADLGVADVLAATIAMTMGVSYDAPAAPADKVWIAGPMATGMGAAPAAPAPVLAENVTQATTRDLATGTLGTHTETHVGEKAWKAALAATMPPVVTIPDTIAAAIETAIGPVRNYLAPGLVADLAERIRPIAVEAAKPAVEVVREVVREIAAAPVAPAGVRPYATIVGTSTMGKLFALKGAQGKLPVSLWSANELTPDPTYQVDVAVMAAVVTAAEHGELVWLAGPMGSGKGSLSREIAARTGREYIRIGFHRATEIIDLQGQFVPVPGDTHGNKMIWQDGVFVASIRRPGMVILLDEPTIAPPGTFAWYQTILDERQVTLPTGEVVHFAPGVIVLIADNTAGFGDETGAYAGTVPANAALVDRAVRVVTVGYLDAKKEALALHKRTGVPFLAAERLAKFAALVRADALKAGGESRSFSYRRLVAFAQATYRDRMSVKDAWECVVLTSRPAPDRETLSTAIGLHFDGETYAREMDGEVIDPAAAPVSGAPISQAPEQVTARDHDWNR